MGPVDVYIEAKGVIVLRAPPPPPGFPPSRSCLDLPFAFVLGPAEWCIMRPLSRRCCFVVAEGWMSLCLSLLCGDSFCTTIWCF